MDERVKIFALGGLDEDGKECIVVDINNDLFVINCGVRFPDRTMPGIDYVIPNFDFLKENKHRVKAYFLLHGHDDETGALAYIYHDVPAPIYCSEVTKRMFLLFAHHAKLDTNGFDFHIQKATSDFVVAGRACHFFHTAHNIADSSGLAIHTSLGNVVFTGDYVVENNATAGFLHDMNAISKIAEEPTLALMTESLYSDRLGYTAPNYKLSPLIESAIKDAEGRIFVSLFSMNLYNLSEMISLAVSTHKKILCYDEEGESILKALQECGQLLIPRNNYASIDEVLRLRDQDIMILMTGFGGKLYEKIYDLATNSHEDKRIRLKESDTFIVASPANANTEIEATDAVDELFRSGCKVINISKKVFYNMHASEEDLKMMISLFKPKYYIPVKGFYKDLLKNGLLALSMGIGLTHQNVFVMENGTSVIMDSKGARLFNENIPHGDLMIDGIGVGDVASNVIDDRKKLSEGVVVLAITVSKKKREIVAGPDVQMRGFVFVKEADAVLKEVSRLFVTTVEDFLNARMEYNLDEIKQNVYEKCLRAIRRQTGREPMVLPLIVEVE